MLQARSRLINFLTAVAAPFLIAATCCDAAQSGGENGLSRVHHVWVIVLENENFEVSFGMDTKAPYLAHQLPKQGVLLTQYFAIAHASLPNYLAIISGQGANPETQNDCQTYSEFKLEQMTAFDQAKGTGCVYPRTIQTLPDLLSAQGLTWRGYMEDMGNDLVREKTICGHGIVATADATKTAEAPRKALAHRDQYAARHDPFVYFHSIIDSPTCRQHVVPLERLPSDLQAESKTPNFSFITPNLCHDGDGSMKAPCIDGEPGGLVSADRFLQVWAPRILQSPAYKKDGLLVITFDEGGYRLERQRMARQS